MLDYWLSHHVFEAASVLYTTGYCSMISVVLDAGLSEQQFCAIRVMVVAKDSEETKLMTVRDCPDPRRCIINCTTDRSTPRHNLGALRRRKFPSTDALRENGVVLALIFELSAIKHNSLIYSAIKFLHRSDIPHLGPLRVVYDNTYSTKCGPLTLFLHTDPCRSPYNRSLATPNAHMVRILPLSNRPSFVGLPSKILRRIAPFACAAKQKTWRRDLFRIGLVCKAWTIVLDLYFQHAHCSHPTGIDYDPVDIVRVARSLMSKRDRAVLMKCYRPSAYYHGTTLTPNMMEYFEAQNTILSLATSVADVIISHTAKPLIPKLIDILCALKEVRNLTVSPRYDPGMPLDSQCHNLSIEDIKKFVVHLPHLIQLIIVDWRKPDKSEWLLLKMPNIFSGWSSQVDPCRNNTRELSSKLEHLTLNMGYLTGPQFLFFAGPPHLPSTLQYVNLRHVQGLANEDLLHFLTHVSSTIKSFSMADCHFSRARDEEYAVDTLMPQMVGLTLLDLSGDIASDLAISRKPARQPTTVASGQTIIPGSMISFDCPAMARFSNLDNALAVTGWESVTLRWEPQDAPNPALLEAATSTAAARGISFFSSQSHRLH